MDKHVIWDPDLGNQKRIPRTDLNITRTNYDPRLLSPNACRHSTNKICGRMTQMVPAGYNILEILNFNAHKKWQDLNFKV